jgi:hypothetical protein
VGPISPGTFMRSERSIIVSEGARWMTWQVTRCGNRSKTPIRGNTPLPAIQSTVLACQTPRNRFRVLCGSHAHLGDGVAFVGVPDAASRGPTTCRSPCGRRRNALRAAC